MFDWLQKELPPSLIPDEYHIHKKVGVVGLELREELVPHSTITSPLFPLSLSSSQYTTQSLAHDSHVTVFPSMSV